MAVLRWCSDVVSLSMNYSNLIVPRCNAKFDRGMGVGIWIRGMNLKTEGRNGANDNVLTHCLHNYTLIYSFPVEFEFTHI